MSLTKSNITLHSCHQEQINSSWSHKNYDQPPFSNRKGGRTLPSPYGNYCTVPKYSILTWYGLILWVLRVLGQGFNQSAWTFFTRDFSGCYATLASPKEGETAVYGYNPDLF